MKQQILGLGKALNRAEQKFINGGRAPVCNYPEVACLNPETYEWSCSYGGYCD
ncbi:hypothetical protein GCM10022393_08400 [Aquimarina addita]|uniref:Uncharacterized protein n=1 Tax=Aquimarina addita TaxID=870485 RepID=A0ABP7XEE1_9FLAO